MMVHTKKIEKAGSVNGRNFARRYSTGAFIGFLIGAFAGFAGPAVCGVGFVYLKRFGRWFGGDLGQVVWPKHSHLTVFLIVGLLVVFCVWRLAMLVHRLVISWAAGLVTALWAVWF